MVSIIECPRDAMQGIHDFIPTKEKIRFLRAIIQCGFDCIDFGSFVSPKYIPQLQDTKEVFSALEPEIGENNILMIVANERGASEACNFEKVSHIGFPFSISEVFQMRNTNSSCAEAFNTVKKILEIVTAKNKQLVVYLSMAFGNPYHELYNRTDVLEWVAKFNELGIKIISLADTVGTAKNVDISYLFNHCITAFPTIEFGAHFHSELGNWQNKIETAYHAGCRRFDGVLKGFGGCPMAGNELVGNIPTENLLHLFADYTQKIDPEKVNYAMLVATEIFSKYH